MAKKRWQISLRMLLLAVAVVPPTGAYIAGYFRLGERIRWGGSGGTLVRIFDSRRLAIAYIPMATLEAGLIGEDVYTVSEAGGEFRVYSTEGVVWSTPAE
jgi:hypothetical protein